MAAMTDGGVSIVRPELDEKPWGGRELENYGLTLPADARIGEALVTANSVRVSTGAGRGRTLGELVADDPGTALGPVAGSAVGGRPLFPMLVKLIDAQENLSIQVHPDDAMAAVFDRLGKTEAWHVLSAKPGSFLYAGLQGGVSSETLVTTAARMNGSSADLLRRIPAKPGATILLPAGTVHALGAGVVVYEIQQPSDITYRLDDWGRVGPDGAPREMHQDAGVAAMRAELRPELIPPVALPANEGRRHLLAMCAKFALERIALPGGGRCPVETLDGPQVVTVIGGAARLGERLLTVGQSAVVWPGAVDLTLEATAPIVVLRGWVPDIGVEFERIASLPGVDPNALGLLSGSLPDMRETLDAHGRTSV